MKEQLFVHPETGQRVAFAEEDLQDMDWDQAHATCAKLGSGWRLPSEEELRLLYHEWYRKDNGNFKPGSYWAIAENTCGVFSDSFLFYHGYEEETRAEKKHVRLVRTLD